MGEGWRVSAGVRGYLLTITEANNIYTERLTGLNDWLAEEMARWQIPGVGLGIIANGEVIFADGFGQRDIANSLPVDTDTLFAIGSCSKAFTTFGMGLLVDEGKLDWDAPLRDYLPEFRLYDPVASDNATPRDIVCHRIGLPRHDLVWYGSDATRQELVATLRHLKPSKSFRSTWQYQNLMYMLAGYLIERISGQTWEDFTRERIFKPLGMTTSQFSVIDSAANPNAARPYDLKKGALVEIPYANIDAIGPAGSINSSIREMLSWLAMQMNGGQHNGEALIKAETLAEMHTPQMLMRITPDIPWYGISEIAHTSYGLGWAIQTYRGRDMIRHTGGIDGFISSVSFFPDEGVGAVILTNTSNSLAPTAINLRLYDTLFGLEPVAWSDILTAHQSKMEALGNEGKAKLKQQRKPDTTPSHSLADYAGSYTHPAYGTFQVANADGALTATYHGLKLNLTHHHYNTFELSGEEADLFTLASFSTSAAGEVDRVSITLEPSVEASSFQRQLS